ncbi:MAG: hypothetical protein E7168_02745 [Firmicutes bacterium]|nr:hypothetical protein [Bacillota bacterium]
MSRESILIPEKKTKIDKIKKKYDNMTMSDDVASKIIKLEITNRLLKVAATSVGIITAIDFVVPDPVLGLDEISLAALTGLFSYASNVVDNKIDDLVTSGNTKVQLSEVNKLTEQLGNVTSSIHNSKKLKK